MKNLHFRAATLIKFHKPDKTAIHIPRFTACYKQTKILQCHRSALKTTGIISLMLLIIQRTILNTVYTFYTTKKVSTILYIYKCGLVCLTEQNKYKKMYAKNKKKKQNVKKKSIVGFSRMLYCFQLNSFFDVYAVFHILLKCFFLYFVCFFR